MVDITELATKRLRDYLCFRKIVIADQDLRSADLNASGFDVIDWGILIGEIQCDCLMMMDWNSIDTTFVCLDDVIDRMQGAEQFEWAIDIHHRMHALTPSEDQIINIKTAREWEWPR
jgi:hypothetical protein